MRGAGSPPLPPPRPAAGAAGSSGLGRSLGLGTAVSIIVASMIGQGIFTTSGYLGSDLQSPWIILALWTAGGVLALAGALSYAELGTLIPRPGGEYVYLRAAFGPLLGFLSGWASFLGGFSAPIAVIAIVFVQHAAFFIPEIDPRLGWKGNLVAAGTILILTWAHCRRVALGVRVQNALTILKVGVVILFLAAAVASGKADPSLLARGKPPPLEVLFPRMGIALLFITISYSGWNAATYIAGEVKSPRRVLPLSALIGTLAVMAIYLALNVIYLAAIPVERMERAPNIALLSAQVYFESLGPGILGPVGIFSLIIMTIQLGTISALILSGSRVYYAMGVDGLAWRGLARLSGDGRTPGTAVVIQGIMAALMVLAADFEPLVLCSSLILVLFSTLTVAALIVLRRRTPSSPEDYRAPPGAPLVYIAGSAGILVAAALFVIRSEVHRRGTLIVAACLLAGVPLYAITRYLGKARDAR